MAHSAFGETLYTHPPPLRLPFRSQEGLCKYLGPPCRQNEVIELSLISNSIVSTVANVSRHEKMNLTNLTEATLFPLNSPSSLPICSVVKPPKIEQVLSVIIISIIYVKKIFCSSYFPPKKFTQKNSMPQKLPNPRLPLPPKKLCSVPKSCKTSLFLRKNLIKSNKKETCRYSCQASHFEWMTIFRVLDGELR